MHDIMNIAGLEARSRISSLFIFIVSLLIVLPARAQSDISSDKARTTIHMLDYMAADYPVAVENGKIINETEYREMKNFAVSIDSLYHDLGLSPDAPEFRQTANRIDSLHQLVLDRAAPTQIAKTARTIKQEVVQQTNITVAPRRWPNMKRGKQVFIQKCASCHGQTGKGDGPLAPDLNPPPTNFHDDQRLSKISPFQAYNTIQLGVEGTSMRAYADLSDQQAWNLAFYLKSLRFKEQAGQPLIDRAVDSLLRQSKLDLATVSQLSDQQLKEKISESSLEVNPTRAVKSLRLYQPAMDTSGYISKTQNLLGRVEKFYANREFKRAYQTALSAYLEGFEPVEAQLGAHNAALMRDIENKMISLRTDIKNRIPADEFSARINSLQGQLDEAQATLDDSDTTPWLSFLLSFSILLREGLEAFLIIITILGILNSLKARRQKKWIHAGWILAVGLGFAGWFFTDWLLAIGGGQRELMEGGLSLVAVLILIYVGFWMHSKSEAKQWKEFIDSKIREKLHGGNLIGLFTISFIAVFREAFESVIFLSAISLEAGPSGDTAIGLGAVIAFVALAVIGYALLKLTVKVPLRSIFRYGSYAIGFFAIIMVGQGIHAVQESGLLSVTPTQLPIQASLIGVYPTLETLLAQGLTIGVLLGLWKYSKSKK